MLSYAYCGGGHATDDGNLHLQLNLPRCHPYVHPEIVANPIIEQVAGAVLHGLVYIRYINGNTACRTTFLILTLCKQRHVLAIAFLCFLF